MALSSVERERERERERLSTMQKCSVVVYLALPSANLLLGMIP
jgi:hypothetical protein